MDNMSNKDIKIAVVKSCDKEFNLDNYDENLQDSYLDGAFNIVIKSNSGSSSQRRDSFQGGYSGNKDGKKDGKESKIDSQTARQKMLDSIYNKNDKQDK